VHWGSNVLVAIKCWFDVAGFYVQCSVSHAAQMSHTMGMFMVDFLEYNVVTGAVYAYATQCSTVPCMVLCHQLSLTRAYSIWHAEHSPIICPEQPIIRVQRIVVFVSVGVLQLPHVMHWRVVRNCSIGQTSLCSACLAEKLWGGDNPAGALQAAPLACPSGVLLWAQLSNTPGAVIGCRIRCCEVD
jgi:hypothetical protein